MTVSMCYHCGGLGPETVDVVVGVSREIGGELGQQPSWRSLCRRPDYVHSQLFVAKAPTPQQHRSVTLLHC